MGKGLRNPQTCRHSKGLSFSRCLTVRLFFTSYEVWQTNPKPSRSPRSRRRQKKIKAIRLPVKNWLERPQRMRVDIKLDEGTDAASTKLEGTQTVDLVPSGTYEYVVKFKAFKEGLCGARITFTNLETKEYLFHDIKVTVDESNTLEVIKLEAPLRQTTRHLITVENPLAASAPVTFSGGDE